METKAENAGESATEIGAEIARDLVAEQFASVGKHMSAEMPAGLPDAKLAEIWSSLIKQLGPCSDLGEPWSEAKAGFTVVRVPMKFGARTLDLKISVANNEIVGFFIVPHEERVSSWLPPAYADLTTFREIEVKVGGEPKPLPGTLSLPNGVESAPAIILVHGSGPQDRDESLGPNRPFRDLAAGLTTKGIAVLRYDKRTKLYPESFADLKNPTVKEETLDDVSSAIEFLKTRPEIDAGRIMVIGHSLGGTLAPRIAAINPSVSRIVILAGAARPLPDIAVAQVEYLAALQGPIDDAAAERIRQLKADAARVGAARPGDEGPPFLGAPLSYWADLNVYDPVAAAATLTTPMLILQGGRDYQVTAEDFDRFQSALSAHQNVACHLLPRLNHLFVSGVGRSTPSEYEVAGHVDAEAIELIAAFVLVR
jgi:dienelactone hydrolase